MEVGDNQRDNIQLFTRFNLATMCDQRLFFVEIDSRSHDLKCGNTGVEVTDAQGMGIHTYCSLKQSKQKNVEQNDRTNNASVLLLPEAMRRSHHRLFLPTRQRVMQVQGRRPASRLLTRPAGFEQSMRSVRVELPDKTVRVGHVTLDYELPAGLAADRHLIGRREHRVAARPYLRRCPGGSPAFLWMGRHASRAWERTEPEELPVHYQFTVDIPASFDLVILRSPLNVPYSVLLNFSRRSLTSTAPDLIQFYLIIRFISRLFRARQYRYGLVDLSFPDRGKTG
ncbi:hypothetical protein PVAR5_7725 [Paecilomyces variotii No. 5]|uniref:Uncharacterized protein n=1 Tax=Byssochlamys spectabilis (strain No. 5 / NBRC 109023) TaxID=1356009 RepID=V5I549_BYSSN|nr:hypothetical protein PVAR5_7725 [Paecilomyces variotii No. 5]